MLLGLKLLDEGYNRLVIANHKDSSSFYNPGAMLTLQPTKDLTLGKNLPIRQMIDLPDDKLHNIYVMCDD